MTEIITLKEALENNLELSGWDSKFKLNELTEEIFLANQFLDGLGVDSVNDSGELSVVGRIKSLLNNERIIKTYIVKQRMEQNK